MSAVVNIEKVKKLIADNPVAAATFRIMAKRERPRATTDLRRLKQEVMKEEGVVCSTPEFLEIFAILDGLKAGKLKLSKEAEIPPRFKWNMEVNSIALAREALGNVAYKLFEEKAKGIVEAATAAAVPPGFTRLPYRVRGVTHSLTIPEDITKEEAAVIINQLKGYVGG